MANLPPQMAHIQPLSHSDLEVTHRQDDSHKEAYNNYPIQHAYYGEYQGLPTNELVPTPPEKRILGLKKRTFIIVAVVAALVIIGAALGGGLGATLGKSKSAADNTPDVKDPNGNTTTTTPSPSGLLASSRLAAVNYTDTGGNVWYAVFFQDQYAALIASVYDPVTAKAWVLANITSSVPQSGQSIRPKSGTPLAAAARAGSDFQINLYYLAEDNTISELVTKDLTADNWAIGTLRQQSKKTAYENTMLGASWEECATPNCVNAPMVVYQTPDQKLTLANGTDWGDRNVFFGFTKGTTIAFFPHGRLHNFMRVYGDQSGTAQELMWGDGVFGTTGFWYGTQLGTDLAPGTLLAGTSFGDQGWLNIYLAQLSPNGTLATHWWNQHSWNTNAAPTFAHLDSPMPKFTGIAVNHDMRFFGIADGKIYEFAVDRAYPLSWDFMSMVKTPDPAPK